MFLVSPVLAWEGQVVGISDGDTITVMRGGKGKRIRLYGIDAPESRQAFGWRAKQFASDLAYRKTVRVEHVDADRYGCIKSSFSSSEAISLASASRITLP